MHALEKEMATHFSILAWRIPGTEEPGGLLCMGSHIVEHNLSDLACMHRCDKMLLFCKIVRLNLPRKCLSAESE